MELIDVTLGPVQRRAGRVSVSWRELEDQQRRRGERTRSLAPGDDVMLRADDESVHRGWVLRNVQGRTDGAYVIVFGNDVARRMAARVGRPAMPQPR